MAASQWETWEGFYPQPAPGQWQAWVAEEPEVLFHMLFHGQVVCFFIAGKCLEESSADFRIVQQPSIGDVKKLA